MSSAKPQPTAAELAFKRSGEEPPFQREVLDSLTLYALTNYQGNFERMFQGIDSNANGLLTFSEFQAGMKKINFPPPAVQEALVGRVCPKSQTDIVRAVFTWFDLDDSKSIKMSEFRRLEERQKDMVEKERREEAARLDKEVRGGNECSSSVFSEAKGQDRCAYLQGA